MSPKPAQPLRCPGLLTGRHLAVDIVIILLGVFCLVSAGCASPLEGFASKDSAAFNKSERIHLSLSANFPPATVGQKYNYVMSVSGGKAPYWFWISSGSLPAGLYLNPKTGTVWGTPDVSATFNFTADVSDSKSGHGDKRSSIIVSGQQQQVTVSVSPTTATVASGNTQQFSATVKGSSNTKVTWSASSGSVSDGGMFTAPQVTKNTTVTVTATSKADVNAKASATVTVTPIAGITSPADGATYTGQRHIGGNPAIHSYSNWHIQHWSYLEGLRRVRFPSRIVHRTASSEQYDGHGHCYQRCRYEREGFSQRNGHAECRSSG